MDTMMNTPIEVERRKSKQGAEAAARRANASAFPGQRYSVERIATRDWAVVLFDGGAADNRSSITHSLPVRAERLRERDFSALGGKRQHHRASTVYRTIG